MSVHGCLTLSVTICFFCPPEADLGWGYTTKYLLLQVMRQTFCLVFSCHISSAPLMCKQAACLQTVWLPSPVPSVKFCPCATQYQAGCHFLGYLTSATTFFFHLKANWEQVEDHCSSHRSMAVAAGTGVPGQGFPLTLPELLRDTGRFEGQHHLLWQHSTC